MAELPKDIRRPGGDLVAPKRPHGRRVLLPAEVEFCKLLKCTEDEYWQFVDTTAAYNGQRPKGYELIPDIQAGTVLGVTIGKAFLVKLGIAVAAATVSYLLTPKPKEQKQGGSRRTADAIGNTRFAPQASFNSLQELARLGEVIPLVFADQRIENEGQLSQITYGGVRINSQLLWSQFVSFGKYQQLKALALFSHGTLADKPDYQGFAVGDTLLNAYNSYKVGVYFKVGQPSSSNRLIESDRYYESDLTFDGPGNDPFVVGIPNNSEAGGNIAPKQISKAFSGARNPTTQTLFGVFAPIPNAQICRLPYELIRAPRGSTKEAIMDMMRKRKKIEFARWPVRCGVTKVGANLTKGLHSVVEGDEIMYQIVGTNPSGDAALQTVYPSKDGDTRTRYNYVPHGVEDVDGYTTSIRENTDNLLSVGEQYLFGTALVLCTGVDKKIPYSIEQGKLYVLTVIEKGEIDLPVSNGTLGTHCDNPIWADAPDERAAKTEYYSLSDINPVYWQQEISGTQLNKARGHRDLYYAHDIY